MSEGTANCSDLEMITSSFEKLIVNINHNKFNNKLNNLN